MQAVAPVESHASDIDVTYGQNMGQKDVGRAGHSISPIRRSSASLVQIGLRPYDASCTFAEIKKGTCMNLTTASQLNRIE